MKREVVRLVTPGTLTEDEFLNPSSPNYLVSLSAGGGDALGLAWADISTGEFAVATSSHGGLQGELSRLGHGVRELLVLF